MLSFRLLIESVLPFWILFFVLTPIWLWATFRLSKSLAQKWKLFDFKRLHASTEGSSYALSYLLIIPLYLLLMFGVIETTLILLSKMGTVYAAFAGTRTAAVYYSEQDPNKRDRSLLEPRRVLSKARINAAQAMIPFASGMRSFQRGIPNYVLGADDYVKSYEAYYDLIENGKTLKAGSRYLKNKYRYAMAYTQVSTNFGNERPDRWDSNIEFKLTYYHPMQFSIIGRIFGCAKMNGFYVTPITTTVELQNEAPQNPEQKLGIRYAAY